MTGQYEYEGEFKDVTIICKDATEFLQVLTDPEKPWRKRFGQWIYRGQNSAMWTLQPSLFRTVKESTESTQQLLIKEWRRITEFAILCRISNLQMASAEWFFGSGLEATINDQEGIATGKYKLDHPVFSLAQHSGIPTHLLDFTYDPLVAAYWACVVPQVKRQSMVLILEAIEEIDAYASEHGSVPASFVAGHRNKFAEVGYYPLRNFEYLVVWMINRLVFSNSQEAAISDQIPEHNPRLREQAGLFIYHRNLQPSGPLPKPFEHVLKEYVSQDSVYRLILPFSKSKQLENQLEAYNVTEMRLYQDYEAVVSTIMQRRQRKDDA